MRIAFDISSLEKEHGIRGVGNYVRNLATELEELSSKSEGLLIDFINFRSHNVNLSRYEIIHYPFTDLFFISLPLFKPTKIVTTVHDIFPIYLGVGDHFKKSGDLKFLGGVKEKYKLPSSFVLYVGDVNNNKNLVNLAESCISIGISLVIVGKQASAQSFDRNHPENQMWVRFLDKFEKDPKILRIGFVPNLDLVALYNLASVYCQPSLYEGFGIPIIEAMACGTPVVTSNTPALAEISGNAALLVNPNDKRDISYKISQILTDPKTKKQLVSKGYLNIKRFSWKKCAKETLDVYKKIIIE